MSFSREPKSYRAWNWFRFNFRKPWQINPPLAAVVDTRSLNLVFLYPRGQWKKRSSFSNSCISGEGHQSANESPTKSHQDKLSRNQMKRKVKKIHQGKIEGILTEEMKARAEGKVHYPGQGFAVQRTVIGFNQHINRSLDGQSLNWTLYARKRHPMFIPLLHWNLS